MSALYNLIFGQRGDSESHGVPSLRLHALESPDRDGALHTNAADGALLGRIRAGDETALDTLYRATYQDLFRYAISLIHAPELAEELVHDVFASFWERREQIVVTGSVRGYLFSAVRYRVLDVRRRTQTAERLAPIEAASPPSSFETPDAAVTMEERGAALRAAMQRLPERQREAVLLRVEGQLSYAELGTVLRMSPDAARMLVSRALADLRRWLTPYLVD